MNSQISLKVFAVVVALMMNGAILGGAAYVFDSHVTQRSSSNITGEQGSSALTGARLF